MKGRRWEPFSSRTTPFCATNFYATVFTQLLFLVCLCLTRLLSGNKLATSPSTSANGVDISIPHILSQPNNHSIQKVCQNKKKDGPGRCCRCRCSSCCCDTRCVGGALPAVKHYLSHRKPSLQRIGVCLYLCVCRNRGPKPRAPAIPTVGPGAPGAPRLLTADDHPTTQEKPKR